MCKPIVRGRPSFARHRLHEGQRFSTTYSVFALLFLKGALICSMVGAAPPLLAFDLWLVRNSRLGCLLHALERRGLCRALHGALTRIRFGATLRTRGSDIIFAVTIRRTRWKVYDVVTAITGVKRLSAIRFRKLARFDFPCSPAQFHLQCPPS